MKFLTAFRIILIGMLIVSTAGCKLKWSDSNSFIENMETPVINEGKEDVPEDEIIPNIPEDEPLLFLPEEPSQNPLKKEQFKNLPNPLVFIIIPENEGPTEQDPQPADENNPVPEPITILLLGPALLGLLGCKRKKS
ncbi:MAG: PEP-CTERM sorting domain-containing protein [Candidatus Omnitrophica bacterium]|nr:PEP-CTERM sorting domain-containing protein [Candidatus Omnitrophota bacterium]